MAMKLLLVAGARPNFMKVAPLLRACRSWPGVRPILVHTGQHYDYSMSRAFFDDLELPEPDHFLGVGSGSHAEQTARIMVAFERTCMEEKPDVVVVVGDVNSTMACAITAKKLLIDVAHVEAGLRSGDMSMPEEVNRVVTDAISDCLFASEQSGVANLLREGKAPETVFLVGNVMIDTLHHALTRLDRAGGGTGPERRKPYAVLTLHRPANVDSKERLEEILRAMARIATDMPVYFSVHPRTRKALETFGLDALLQGSGIEELPPLSYLEFLALWKEAALVLTDSGGIQEETTALGIPCFTIRENTERPITVEEGSNTVVGTRADSILREYARFRAGEAKRGRVPEMWDGHAAERILEVLARKYGRSRGEAP